MLFVQDKDGKFKKVTAEGLIQKLHSAKDQIETATGYESGYLKHGGGCDSSEDCRFRMAYVEKAEAKFLKDNQRTILIFASELVQKDIDSLIPPKSIE